MTRSRFEGFYHHLVRMDSSVRKAWLLDHRPTDISPAHWWISLIDAAMSDMRCEWRGWPRTRPRADVELAASLIDWALEDGFPIEFAVGELVQLLTITLAAGRRPDRLPANARPDSIARQALTSFGFTRAQAIARAAQLRAKPVSDDDYVKPGENVADSFRLLNATDDDYKDYHRLLGIQKMLGDISPVMQLLEDPDLAADLAAWLNLLPDLDPVPVDRA